MNKTTSCVNLLLLAVCLQLAAAAAAFAGAPLKINFQGRLDENGQPAGGSKTFVFKIYDAVSDGSLVWTSAAQALALSNGVFSALLEAGAPAALSTATFAGARFVELTVDGVALAPRQAMVSAPYALVAQALAPDADIPPTAIADGSVTDAKVLLTTAAITSGRFSDDRVLITTGAFASLNGADQLVKLEGSGALPALDASALTALNPANLGAAVGAAKGGTGLTAAGASGNLLRSDGAGWTSWVPDYISGYAETDPVFLAQKGAALGVATLDAAQLVPVAQIPGLAASKITSGKFNDHTLALSTGAFPGGFNGAGQLVKLEGSGALPALDGSALIGVSVSAADITGTLVDSQVSLTTSAVVYGRFSDDRVSVSTGAISAGIFGDDRVNVSTRAITAGVFSDDRIRISTGAFYADFNGPYQLLQLDAFGRFPATFVADGLLSASVVASSVAVGKIYAGALQDNAVTDAKVYLTTEAISSGRFGDMRVRISTGAVMLGRFTDDRVLITTGAFVSDELPEGGAFNAADQLVRLSAAGALPALEASALTALNPANLGAAVGAAKGGTGQDSSGADGFPKVTAGSWSFAALAAGDIPELSASKITTGKFNDHLLALSTGAFPGGFNGAGQLPKLDESGRLGISTGTVNSALTLGGAVSLPIKTVTAHYTIGAGDYTVLVDPVVVGLDPVPVTVTFPAVSEAAGRVYVIKVLTNVNAVSLNTAGAALEGQAGNYAFGADLESLIIQSDGTAWHRLGGTAMLAIGP